MEEAKDIATIEEMDPKISDDTSRPSPAAEDSKESLLSENSCVTEKDCNTDTEQKETVNSSIVEESVESKEKDFTSGATATDVEQHEKDVNSVNSDGQEVLKLKEGTVQFQGVDRLLHVTAKSLILKGATLPAPKKQSEAIEMIWQDVIWAEVNSKAPEDMQKNSFNIHYMQNQRRRLRAHCINLTTVNEPAENWIKVIQEECARVKGRPKKVIVIVNPIGGSGKATQAYQRKISPIFQLAQIEADVIYTERSKHAIEIGETHDFSPYDGVIVVGGDGLYQELLKGMTIQMQKSAGVDYNDVNAEFACLNKPVAILPAGTGNGVSGWCNGSVDMETAILRILRGETHRSQILTLHSNGKFFCVCGLLFGYGAFSDLIKRTDELRWMKRARYPYCMLTHLFKKKRRTQYIVEYCVASESQNGQIDGLTDASKQEPKAVPRWIKHDSQGKEYVGVFSFLANPTDKGDHAILDLFTDRIRLYVDTGAATLRAAKSVMNFMGGKKTENYPPNLDVIDNVQRIRIKVVTEEGNREEEVSAAMARARELDLYVNIDGECLQLEIPEMEFRVIPAFIPLFACEME